MNDKKGLDKPEAFRLVAKTVATLAFAGAVGSTSIHVGMSSLKNEEISAHKALAGVFLALNIRRAYKNLKATFDNDEYLIHSHKGHTQQALETAYDISVRESFNVMLQSSLINTFISLPDIRTTAPFLVLSMVTRDIGSKKPEGDKGHLRPTWLRKIMGDRPSR